MFNIDWKYLINVLLPYRLRKPKQLAWINTILSYLRQIYDSFVKLRSGWIYDINFTGQIIYLEKKIQDELSCPGIKIVDGQLKQPTYLHRNSEGKLPAFLYVKNGMDLYPHETLTPVDFYVILPCELSNAQILLLKSIIAQYKLIEKNYKIQTNG